MQIYGGYTLRGSRQKYQDRITSNISTKINTSESLHWRGEPNLFLEKELVQRSDSGDALQS